MDLPCPRPPQTIVLIQDTGLCRMLAFQVRIACFWLPVPAAEVQLPAAQHKEHERDSAGHAPSNLIRSHVKRASQSIVTESHLVALDVAAMKPSDYLNQSLFQLVFVFLLHNA